MNKILSKSDFHKVIALSNTEVGKIVYSDKFSFVNIATGVKLHTDVFKKDINNEILLLKKANKINDLMPNFFRKESFKSNEEMMVMERLYPINPKNLSKVKKKKFLKFFEEKLLELHSNGFGHGDIMHPIVRTKDRFDNIIVTETGLRLIPIFKSNYSVYLL